MEPRSAKISSSLTPGDRKRRYVQMALITFAVQLWQFLEIGPYLEIRYPWSKNKLMSSLGRKRVYVQFWNFCQWPNSMLNFENRPVSWKPFPVERKTSLTSTTCAGKRAYVQRREQPLYFSFAYQLWHADLEFCLQIMFSTCSFFSFYKTFIARPNVTGTFTNEAALCVNAFVRTQKR